jgi:hypothetical protein
MFIEMAMRRYLEGLAAASDSTFAGLVRRAVFLDASQPFVKQGLDSWQRQKCRDSCQEEMEKNLICSLIRAERIYAWMRRFYA